MEEPIIDPNYEFEAPQFVNFSSVLDDEDDYADAWFGKFEINLTEKVLFWRSPTKLCLFR